MMATWICLGGLFLVGQDQRDKWMQPCNPKVDARHFE